MVEKIEKVQTYILHWGHRLKDGTYRPWNDLLLNCIRSIQNASDSNEKSKIDNQINVIYDCNTEFYEDLIERIPANIELIKDYKNKGASGARNIAIENAEDTFVILDNDMKVGNGWLTNLYSELKHAERYFGSGCAISYSQMPYLEEGVVRSGEYGNVLKLRQFIEYCNKYDIPVDNRGNLGCRPPFDAGDIKTEGTGVTYSGWRLSNFITNKKFIDRANESGAGFSSESLWGWWGEDMEWATRVFNTECRLLESHTVFVQHIMSFTSGTTMDMKIRNADIMLEMYGKDWLDGVTSGKVWPELIQEQIKRFGYRK